MSATIYAYPDTLETTFQGGESLSFLPLRSTLRRQVNNPDENPVGEAIVIIEGLILQAIYGAGSSFKRIGLFVLDSLDNTSFFGLVATLPESGGGVALISADGCVPSAVTIGSNTLHFVHEPREPQSGEIARTWLQTH